MAIKEKINILYSSDPSEGNDAVSTSAWGQQFRKVLEIRLKQLSNKHFVVREFANEALLKFDGSGIVVIIGNQSFLTFIQKNNLLSTFQKTLKKPHIIIQNPTEFEAVQAFLSRTMVYKFYKIDIQTEQIKLFGMNKKQELKNAFWGKLDDLARDLSLRLHTENQIDTSTNHVKKTIYLAEVDDTVTEYRAKIKRELQEYGYEILPNHALPIDVVSYEKEVSKLLEQCEISIHIFGETYGFILRGSEISVSHLQNQIAAAKSKIQTLKRLLWIPSQTKPDDEFQEELLEHLKNDPKAQQGGELFETTLEEFKFAIHKKLEDGTAIEQPSFKKQSIYIICDSADEKELNSLCKELEKAHWTIYLPLQNGDEYQARMHHITCLKTSESVLIYYSQGSSKWLEASLKDLVKVAGYGRKQLWKHRIIYHKKAINKTLFYLDTMKRINAISTTPKQLIKCLT